MSLQLCPSPEKMENNAYMKRNRFVVNQKSIGDKMLYEQDFDICAIDT